MRVLAFKTDAVTRGVLDKDVRHEPDLVEVTYVDDNGTPRTAYAHRDGPFRNPEDIARAAIDGTLHEGTEDVPADAEAPSPAGPVFD